MGTLFKPTSYRKGAAWAVAATFLWKLISFASALLMAALFGATYKTDVYFYLIMLIGFGLTFANRLNSTVLIPEALFLQQKDPAQAHRFVSMWFYLYLVCGILIVAGGIFIPVQLGCFFSRFQPQELQAEQLLLTLGFLLFALQLLTYYLQSVAEMYKLFGTAWLGVLNALCPFLWLLGAGREIGLIAMVYGFLSANVLQIVALLLLLKQETGKFFLPAWVHLPKRIKQNALSGQVLAVFEIINSLVPVYLISSMGAGMISALNYCRQLTDSPTEILTNRVVNISKIALTEDAAKQTEEKFNQTFLASNFILLFFLTPLVIFSCYFAKDIVSLFFERGNFTGKAVQDTVSFLRPFIFTVLLLAPAMIQGAAVAAMRKIKENFPFSVVSSLIFLSGVWFLVPRYGAFSFAYISVAGLVISALINGIFFRRYLPSVPFFKMYADTGVLILLNLISLIPAAWLRTKLPVLPYYWTIFVCGIVYVGILAVLYNNRKYWKRLTEGF